MSCKDCKYFEPMHSVTHVGSCTFNPPATIRRLSDDFHPWATVRIDDTCSMETPAPEDEQ